MQRIIKDRGEVDDHHEGLKDAAIGNRTHPEAVAQGALGIRLSQWHERDEGGEQRGVDNGAFTSEAASRPPALAEPWMGGGLVSGPLLAMMPLAVNPITLPNAFSR